MTIGEESAINKFLAQMHQVTVSLVKNAESFPINSSLGSGVLIPSGEDFLLLTAGHLFNKPGPWTLETTAVYHSMSLHIALSDLRLLRHIDTKSRKYRKIDLAWARISSDDIRAAIRDSHGEIPVVSLPIYRGPLDIKLSKRGCYGYAASNRAMLDSNLNVLVREASYEVCMTLKSRDPRRGIVIFDLARKHQGHKYYRGASGAPIADTEGQIVALLIGGEKKKGTLIGVELSRYKDLFM